MYIILPSICPEKEVAPDTVALVEFGAGLNSLGKTAVKWAEDQSGALPVDRIAFSSGWTADSNGVLGVNSAPLGPSGAGADLGPGAVHSYHFTPVPNSAYTVTLTRENPEYYYIYAAAVWADGGGTLMTHSYYYYNDYNKDDTSPAFIANKLGTDIIIMVYDGTGYGKVQRRVVHPAGFPAAIQSLNRQKRKDAYKIFRGSCRPLRYFSGRLSSPQKL
jgi:hypothetical protein